VTIDDFLRKALEPQRATRKGQHFINCLFVAKPAMARRLKGLGLDPYYVDSKLSSAIQFVVDNWKYFPSDEDNDIVGVDE
jgi:hypothetical protein